MKANLKRHMAVMLAFMIGGCGCYSLGNVSRAAEMEEMAEVGEYEEGMESTNSQVGDALEEGNSDIDSNEPRSGDAGEQSEVSIDSQGETVQKEASANGCEDETMQVEDNDSADGAIQEEDSDAVGESEFSEQEDAAETVGCEGTGAQEGAPGTVDSVGQEEVSGDNTAESNDQENIPGSEGGSGQDGNSDGSDQPMSGEQGNDQEIDTVGGVAENATGDTAPSGEQKAEVGEKSGTADMGEEGAVSGLTVPEKMNLTLDPYEIEGRGQVYSEQHVFRNAGTTTGKLTLYNFFCVPQEQSGVIVRTDREGIHDGDGKEIYVELMFANGDAVTFLEDGSGKYEIELGAGEELVVYFSGELNENSATVWTSGDIKVSLSYLWDVEEQQPYSEMPEDVGKSTGDVSGGDMEPGAKVEASEDADNDEGVDSIPDVDA